MTNTRNLVIIDVHSGLGPFGNDTLMTNEHLDVAQTMYQKPNNKVDGLTWSAPFALELQTLPVGMGNYASDGYDLMTGDVQSQYAKLFQDMDFVVCITQEFGTYPGPFVVSLNESFPRTL